RATTDEGPKEPFSPMCESVQNIFTIMSIVSTPDTLQYFKDKYNSCEIRYGDLKKQLAEDIISHVAPIRERITDIYKNEEYLSRVVREGGEKARESASKTIKEVRELMGIRSM
ncbi:MAG: tryptophan--tRNA ligase, partial [Rikenellaceae bacterium]